MKVFPISLRRLGGIFDRGLARMNKMDWVILKWN